MDSINGTIFAGILGGAATVGAGIGNYLFLRNRSKWTNTMSLLNDFNSVEMMKARMAALQFIKKYPNYNYEELEQLNINDECFQHKRDCFWLVLAFYERVSILAKYGELKNKACLDSFGERFFWWWGLTIEQQMPDSWSTQEHFIYLYRWFMRLGSAYGKTREVDFWLQKGTAKRKFFVSQSRP